MDSQNMQMAASALKNAATSKPKVKAKLRMRINPTDNDRFIVDHEPGVNMSEPMQTPTQHSLNDVDELVEHIKKHYGKKAEAKEEKKEPAAEKLAEAAAAEKA